MLPRFNARWPQRQVEVVGALSQPEQSWRREVNFRNPPWALLERLAVRLRDTGAGGQVYSEVVHMGEDAFLGTLCIGAQ